MQIHTVGTKRKCTVMLPATRVAGMCEQLKVFILFKTFSGNGSAGVNRINSVSVHDG